MRQSCYNFDAGEKIKPEIPPVGWHAIPLRDETELEMRLAPLHAVAR
jgi:hypothetical protein